MIYSLTGELTYIGDQFLVVECGGVGFKCFTSVATAANAGRIGDQIRLYTYLSVKEDALDLYGFKTENELRAFKLLISVSGVGPKAAVSILSEMSADKLSLAVAAGDTKAITRANGVGKKIAERIVLELKDKMAGVTLSSSESSVSAAASVAEDSPAGEAVAALVALGFSKSDAAAAVGAMDSSLPADEMIRQGLRQLSKNL
ncbi:holliday junction DNA helicase RuvA [Clostridium sp. CAG:678]|uniref:Holliday junction branch migration complex subunit RuvA n=1 Tax=Candidatus Eubacterium faecale TaxID=2838568 RepID=A0A9D2S8T6_9FIRM|nr:holliday junction DNA helicase RuvA [Clostridium sp. CAG:678]HJB74309.1 Holliday junction branch migration protein RuvA [Candidatus Eubacterium faecale]